MLASNNQHKLREFREILCPLGFTVLSPVDLGLKLEVEESGSTFAANAVLKAEAFRDLTHSLTISDDSGLVVDALDGGPGVHSARFGGPGLDDAGRTTLLLRRMDGIPDPLRTARFVAVIAVAAPDCATWTVQESVEGFIAHRAAGNRGFGYDPVFHYPPLGKTFGELQPAEKEAVSHRGKAARRVASLLHQGAKQGYT